MQNTIEKAIQLKKTLVDFVYKAEGEIAVALETYAAEKNKKNRYSIQLQNLLIDLFISEGKINNQSLINIFLEKNSALDAQDIKLIKQWQNNFIGLFEIQEIQDDYYQLMNWLTAKAYKVYCYDSISDKKIKKLQSGEIILTIIAPINHQEWFFFSDSIIKGKLNQPKLAVAIGEFRDNYPEFLYADAEELLEQAWSSVAVYHQEFIDYFGEENFNIPGYELEQKINELQKIMRQKRLAKAGIDESKSLSEILAKSGTSEVEFAETATDLGADAEAINNLIKNGEKLSMVTPKIEMPAKIKQAESVTVFCHPKWGQIFLPNFIKFINLLASKNPASQENSNLFIRKYLEQPTANYYVWQQLKQKYPETLEHLLQKYLEQNDFNLAADLDRLLLKYDKSSTPQLPSIASVPLHLNNLFEAAVEQVQKNKSKRKKIKKKKGFF